MKRWPPSSPFFQPFCNCLLFFLFRRLAKRDAYKLPEKFPIHKKFAEAQIDTSGDDPSTDKAYAHPGYEQPAYKYVQFKLNYSGISCSYTLCLIR